MDGRALFVAVDDGIYASFDGADSWEPYGPRGIVAKSLRRNSAGDLYVVGTMEMKVGVFGRRESHAGLFVLRAGKSEWEATRLIDRYDREFARQQTANGSIVQLSADIFLAATGSGVWAVGERGRRCVQVGPRIDGELPKVHNVVVSRGFAEGPATHALILCNTFDRVYWCRWGDGARGNMQYWYGPYGMAGDQDNTTLIQLAVFGDSIAAWTRYGVYLNWDARGANWNKINDPLGTSDFPWEGPLLGATCSPDGKIFGVNNHGIFIGDRVGLSEVNDWKIVWSERDAPEWEFGRRGFRPEPPIFSPPSEFDRVAYAVSRRSGILKSTDGGMSWRPANRGLNGPLRSFDIVVT